ncbi:MAG TPA: SMI1/KNR4 family protein [Pyrinomonadaceae bacterium]|nr:SMI1/KNR4 family protein [Pyrinomonadaceae bacterium]
MFQTGEALRKFWLRRGVRLNPGASEAEIAAFEAKHHVRLPADFRDYFAVVNGFDGSESWMTDDDVITFLGLHEVKPLSEYWSPGVAGADSYFVFADYSISAHVYAIRLTSDSGHGNPVAVVYDGEPVKVADSFSGFVEGYLENSCGVLFPDPRA